ncbi:MAG: hypothetical protein H7221_04110 [Flavobacterium sp.]|nr:hypothetical protein [Flavobacterium sp.]
MKTDASLVLYEKYYKLKNQTIEVELRNHLCLNGKFKGFFKGNTTYISKWHLVDASVLFETDNFGFLVGEIINQKDIFKIKFMEDNSVMNFN